VPDGVVESVKSIVREFRSIIFGDVGFTGNDDLSLDARESLGDNGDGCRLLVVARDSCIWFFVLLAYAGVEAISPRKVLGRVSPDVQGFLWAWGSGYSDTWGGMWGGRGSLVGRLAMWLVVGCSGELLAYSLKFGSDASDLLFEFADSVHVGSLGREHSLFRAFKLE
jgi:hypothetical protein